MKYYIVDHDTTELYKEEKEIRSKNTTEYLFDRIKDVVFKKYPRLSEVGELSLCYGRDRAFLSIDVGNMTTYSFGRLCKNIDGLNIPKVFTNEGHPVLAFSSPKKFKNIEVWDILKEITALISSKTPIKILSSLIDFKTTMWTDSKNGRFYMMETFVYDFEDNLLVSQCDKIDMPIEFKEIQEWEKMKIESEYKKQGGK